MPRNALRSAVLLLAVLSAPAWANPAILLFPAVGHPGEVTIQGRVLKEAPTGGSSTLSRNLRRLTAPNWVGAPVEITFQGVTQKTRSEDDGLFKAHFKLAPRDAPGPGLEPVEAKVPGAVARSTVRIVQDGAPFFVISDFDDTVAVTNVTSKRGLLKAALLQDSDTHPPVPGMADFYQCLIEHRTPTPGLAFVSGSPHQFTGRMLGFLAKNQFPFAGLYLRDLGPDTLSGYKQPVIRELFARVKQDAILIGDSGEKDPEIYAQMRKEFPDRVLEIYIHDVGRTEDASRFTHMVLFKDGRDAATHALGKGYITQACFDEKFGK